MSHARPRREATAPGTTHERPSSRTRSFWLHGASHTHPHISSISGVAPVDAQEPLEAGGYVRVGRGQGWG